MKTDDFERAVELVHREGRVLERRILEAVFDGGPPEAVAAALRPYQNRDGGFGYGLEPDKRTPLSQPLDTEVAWQSLDWVGLAPADLIGPACDHLASLGAGVGCLTPAAVAHPHAAHWAHETGEPSLNPTASLAGYLWAWGIEHPWRADASAFCWAALADEIPDDAHAASGILRFLQHVPDRERAEAAVESLRPRLPTMSWLRYDPDSDGYGVSPLALVPAPDSPWVGLFPSELLERHLDQLEASQADDGGWTIAWTSTGPAAVSAWRGRVTLDNLLVLRAYGRLG